MPITAQEPPYRQLARSLRIKITSGELGPGDQLPSVPQLSRDVHVSRQTAQRALDVLRDEGFTLAIPGRGTFVREALPTTTRDAPQFYQWEKDRALIESDSERGKTGTIEQHSKKSKDEFDFFAEFTNVALTGDIAELFSVAEGTQGLQREFRTIVRATGLLTGISRSFVKLALWSQNPSLIDSRNEPWPGGTQHQLRTLGIELDRIDDIVTARPATEDDRQLLSLPSGSAVIGIRKISIATTGEVVEVSDVTIPSYNTTLRYSTTLARWEK